MSVLRKSYYRTIPYVDPGSAMYPQCHPTVTPRALRHLLIRALVINFKIFEYNLMISGGKISYFHIRVVPIVTSGVG